MRSKLLKRLTLADLEFFDGVYNVGHLVDIDGSPWVSKDAAEEILEMSNSHIDWIIDTLMETRDTARRDNRAS
jgi:hypothetical protein